jgi:hypothetical protein
LTIGRLEVNGFSFSIANTGLESYAPGGKHVLNASLGGKKYV